VFLIPDPAAEVLACSGFDEREPERGQPRMQLVFER
jgi:hypothetical protein